MPEQKNAVLEPVDIATARRWAVSLAFTKRDADGQPLTVNILWIEWAPTEVDACEEALIWAHTKSKYAREIAGAALVWRQAVEITCKKCGG